MPALFIAADISSAYCSYPERTSKSSRGNPLESGDPIPMFDVSTKGVIPDVPNVLKEKESFLNLEKIQAFKSIRAPVFDFCNSAIKANPSKIAATS